MPTKNREERKERVKKYLQWVRMVKANSMSHQELITWKVKLP